MDMNNETYRQGDVLITRIEAVPEGAEKKDNVLAYGEATGHHHTAEGAEIFIKAGKQYMVVRQKAVVKHQEHQQIELPEGIYEVGIQREYSPQENRRVMD